jgi:hypothetical protein
VNAKSGYHIETNEIRYGHAKEMLAKKCLAFITSKKIFSNQPVLKEIPQQSQFYMSVFVRNK